MNSGGKRVSLFGRENGYTYTYNTLYTIIVLYYINHNHCRILALSLLRKSVCPSANGILWVPIVPCVTIFVYNAMLCIPTSLYLFIKNASSVNRKSRIRTFKNTKKHFCFYVSDYDADQGTRNKRRVSVVQQSVEEPSGIIIL